MHKIAHIINLRSILLVFVSVCVCVRVCVCVCVWGWVCVCLLLCALVRFEGKFSPQLRYIVLRTSRLQAEEASRQMGQVPFALSSRNAR